MGVRKRAGEEMGKPPTNCLQRKEVLFLFLFQFLSRYIYSYVLQVMDGGFLSPLHM